MAHFFFTVIARLKGILDSVVFLEGGKILSFAGACVPVLSAPHLTFKAILCLESWLEGLALATTNGCENEGQGLLYPVSCKM